MCHLPRQVYLHLGERFSHAKSLYSVTWVHHNQRIQALVCMEDIFMEPEWASGLSCVKHSKLKKRRESLPAREEGKSLVLRISILALLMLYSFGAQGRRCGGQTMGESRELRRV